MPSLLTNQLVEDFKRSEASTHQRNVQGQAYVPVKVDLSAVGVNALTLGKALLIAVNADVALAKRFGITLANVNEMTKKDEEFFLSNIEYTGLVPNVTVKVFAYFQSTIFETAIANEIYYRPSCCVFRNYAEGAGANDVLVQVGYSF